MLKVGSPYDSDVLEVIEKIIDTINSNPNLPKNPDNPELRAKTIYERALELLSLRGKVGVNHSQLKQLVIDYGEVGDIEKATRKLISRLRAKIEEEGYILVFYRPKEDKQSYYFIIRTPS